jgi:hypothetical protein
MRFLRAILGSAMFLGASLAPAMAAGEVPWPGANWFLWKTDQGCYFYEAGNDTAADEARIRRTWYFSVTWEGSPCSPGKLINGSGTMVYVANLKATTGRPGRAVNCFLGTMVNGLWNGSIVQSDDYPGMEPHTYPPQFPVMGCNPKNRFRDPQDICRPPVPPPALLEGPP